MKSIEYTFRVVFLLCCFSCPSLAEDQILADFENGYGDWQVEGNAFGESPANGTLPGQQEVLGYRGDKLVIRFWTATPAPGR